MQPKWSFWRPLWSFVNWPDQFFDLLSSFASNIELEIVGNAHDEVVADANLVDFNVVFSGFQNDIRGALSRADIFYYPLRINHYGTGEIALLEAMSAGLPSITFNNFAESSIITNSITGFLCDNSLEFLTKLSYLIDNPSLRRSLGANARNYIVRNNSLSAFSEFLSNVFNTLVTKNASTINLRPNYFDKIYGSDRNYSLGFLSFLLSLDSFDSEFLDVQEAFKIYLSQPSTSIISKLSNFFETNPYYKNSSKGGLAHYLHVFPDDSCLKKLYSLLGDAQSHC